MMTREQIERIALNCGVKVSYTEAGKGGFIIDTTNSKYETLTDFMMNYLGVADKNKNKYFAFDENTFLAA